MEVRQRFASKVFPETLVDSGEAMLVNKKFLSTCVHLAVSVLADELQYHFRSLLGGQVVFAVSLKRFHSALIGQRPHRVLSAAGEEPDSLTNIAVDAVEGLHRRLPLCIFSVERVDRESRGQMNMNSLTINSLFGSKFQTTFLPFHSSLFLDCTVVLHYAERVLRFFLQNVSTSP